MAYTNKIVNGVQVPLTADEIIELQARDDAWAAAQVAVQAEQTRLDAIDATIGADATIQSLKLMSSADFDTWWAANVTNLAQANNILKRIARVVLRRVL